MKKIFLFMIILLLVVSFNSLASDYPSKDIAVICGWGAGGGSDAISRKISAIAEKILGTSMYVVNVEGGQSGVAAKQVMDSDPDGYTLGTLTYDAIITVPYRDLIDSYDLDQLKLICVVTTESDGIVVRSDAKWKTIDDLINDAKNRPGEIKICIGGPGSGDHLSVLMVEEAYGVDFREIPYPGGTGPVIEALLSGELDAGMKSFGDFASLIESGELIPLAELSSERNPAYPDVPTFKELGHEGLERYSFIIVAAPSETPNEVLEILDKAFYDAQHSEEFRSWLASIGVTPTYYGMSEVTGWVMEYQGIIFKLLDGLVEKGVIEK